MILYSNDCPKCRILKEKLDNLHIEYTICDDFHIMLEKNFRSVPMLEVDNKVMTFSEALQWLNKGESNA